MPPVSFAFVGALIASLGGLYYLAETLAGRAQPNRVTYLLWGLFPLVIFAAQRAKGVAGPSWATLVAGLTPLLIVSASLACPGAYWRSAPRDYALMGAALLGIVLWAWTDNPNLALLLALLADALASVPTLIKAYRQPQSESWVAYGISTLGFGLSLLSIRSHTLESTAFLAYVFFLNATLTGLSARRGAVEPLAETPKTPIRTGQ